MKKHFPCDVCPKDFTRLTDLKTHLRECHPEEYNVKYGSKCGVCLKYFPDHHRLRNHILQVHEKVKDHECHICFKTFGQLGTMKRHIVMMHDKTKDFKCTLCTKDFSTNGKLISHFQVFIMISKHTITDARLTSSCVSKHLVTKMTFIHFLLL